jgi:isoquinoline 1-oxidoreductase subunit beta
MSTVKSLSAESTRRDFLKTGTLAGASLVIGFHLPARMTQQGAGSSGKDAAGTKDSARGDFQPNAFIEIKPSGEIFLTVARSEMGQGVRTSLAMILAEELDADWARVTVRQADFDTKYGDMTTGGSASVRSSWDPLRKAGATARDMLMSAAAQMMSVPKEECRAIGGSVIEHTKTGRKVGYGLLVEKASGFPAPKDVPLKNYQDYRIVGTKRKRVDDKHIVIGEAHYGIDTKVPGMLYASVTRPAVFGGRVKTFDASKAQAAVGVRKVVEVPRVELPPLFGEERAPNSGHQHYLWGGVAVVADSTWRAVAARRALTVEWDDGPGASESTEGHRAELAELLKSPGKELRKIGEPEAAFASAPKKVEAEYETPFLAHMAMEPPNCTAFVRDGKCEVWAPTQNAGGMATALQGALGLPASAITIHVTLLGGGFGRRLNIEYGVEAALISRAVGAPVKVTWTREDDISHDFYRPMTRHRMRAGLDAQNQAVAWLHHIAAPSTDGTYLGGDIPDIGGTEIAGVGLPGGSVANYFLEQSFLHTMVPRGYWRAVDPNWNHFAVESFIDEIAAAAGKDPVEMRKQLIAGTPAAAAADSDERPVNIKRLHRVIDLAAEKSGWGKSLAAGETGSARRGRGIAALYSWGSYVANVAEVSVGKDGTLRVNRVVVAIDCGQVINPDMVMAQMEGGVAFGLTSALYDEITIENGQVKQTNFDTYPMLRIADMPKVEVYMVPSHETPGGIGEPGVPCAAPAVANAIFAATGKRLRRLPFQTSELAQT